MVLHLLLCEHIKLIVVTRRTVVLHMVLWPEKYDIWYHAHDNGPDGAKRIV